ncbi:hypothetical protein UK23_40555 [Lentzea aerocolonigenes]|uniref:Uncharacterized protein n=1 Tax=Lentzea aerocolonigenes TaxID=68170 RepID=A0A0F0GGX5_LENAE|nr:hypothetical protein [Lentzea aerocolonigenes]KJK40107.1 hypothetical protein UK23_40555 [Lentzea aerocolonigenes]
MTTERDRERVVNSPAFLLAPPLRPQHHRQRLEDLVKISRETLADIDRLLPQPAHLAVQKDNDEHKEHDPRHELPTIWNLHRVRGDVARQRDRDGQQCCPESRRLQLYAFRSGFTWPAT